MTSKSKYWIIRTRVFGVPRPKWSVSAVSCSVYCSYIAAYAVYLQYVQCICSLHSRYTETILPIRTTLVWVATFICTGVLEKTVSNTRLASPDLDRSVLNLSRPKPIADILSALTFTDTDNRYFKKCRYIGKPICHPCTKPNPPSGRGLTNTNIKTNAS